MLTATSLVAHLGNYLFYLVSARQLNPGEFAEVTSLTALATIVFMPFNGVQAAGARDGRGWPPTESRRASRG